jgi:hypothetical protein
MLIALPAIALNATTEMSARSISRGDATVSAD